ncbi:MAG: ABC transporter substrate-binding protein [Propionibacterium sp.]|nr:ABC transporter substrate-binding protein [Propionibacterium sp.]
MRLRKLLTGALAATLLTSMAACGGSSGDSSSTDSTKPLKVMADVIPHAELIREAQSEGLLDGTKVNIVEISGDVDVNQLTEAGDMDANFFQHMPYLDDWNANHPGSDLVPVATVHLEPLGLYSKKITALRDVPDDAVIAIPADATNQARGLFLLEDAGLIKLDVDRNDPNLDYSQITDANVSENPKNISFIKIDRPQLAASLDDPAVNLSIVNGNYALEAGLIPANDALILEQVEGNPYANVLVTKATLKDDPRVKALATALESPELAQYIIETYQGSVLPVNG